MKSGMLKTIYDKYTTTHDWNIGFVNLEIQNILEKDNLDIKWLKHPYADRWFADPFILRITSREIILLAEEYYRPGKKGRISRLIVDKNKFALIECEVVLELTSHLSFPAIFRDGNDVYIYPENSSIGKLLLYRYFEETNNIEMVSELNGEPLTDAIITTTFGKPYIFSTRLPNQNKNILNIYSSDKWKGVYVLDHTVNFNDNCARCAGDLFEINNTLIRPAQDCNDEYGKGIVLQEVIFNGNRFIFKEIKRFYSTSRKWNLGMHTLNVYGGIIVTDGKKYHTPIVRHILICIKVFAKKILRHKTHETK